MNRPTLGQFIREHHATIDLAEFTDATQAMGVALNARCIAALRKLPARRANLLAHAFWSDQAERLELMHGRMCAELQQRIESSRAEGSLQ